MTAVHLSLFVWIFFATLPALAALYTFQSLAQVSTTSSLPQVLVITCVKNEGSLHDDFFRRLRRQTCPTARIVVVLESNVDPSYAVANSCAQGPGLPMSVLVAGRSVDSGQKIWNLLAALKTVEEADEIVAFVDADTLPDDNWLLRLVMPIVRREAEAVSGYRWILPYGNRWGSYLVAAANNAIACIPRSRFWNVAWGGSIAVKRSLLDRIEIASWWKGALSDDLQLTRALWSHGIRIVCPQGFIIPTPVDCDAIEGFEFGRRQYIITRTHLFRYWIFAAAIALPSLLILFVALGYASQGDRLAQAALLIILGLSQVRAYLRGRVDAWLLQDRDLLRYRPVKTKQWIAAFIAPLFHALCIITALPSRRIRWSGIVYDIHAPQRIYRSHGG
jgi:cellulose synthase/poly-beta-1,6-N-acetylglucosamine synthase-like glycosyltransferase